MAEKEKQKESLIYYLCGKLKRGKLDKEMKHFIKETPELEVLRAKIIEIVEYIEAYAATGQVQLMDQPLEDLDSLLSQNGLYVPDLFKNELVKIGLLNGIPREFQDLTEAMDQRNAIGIAKHWKTFQRYMERFAKIFQGGALDEGEKAVLGRWIDEYNKLKEVLADPFHIYRQD